MSNPLIAPASNFNILIFSTFYAIYNFMRKKIFSIVFILGFCVFLSQIVIIRELFVIFYGNELTLGIIFFFWLTGNGTGSYISRKIMPDNSSIKNLPRLLLFGQILLFLLLFIIVFLLKSGLILINPIHGEIIGLGTMILNSFIFIAPFCLLTGFLFPLACRILNNYINEPSKAAGYTYMLDASGAGAAGIIGNFVLLRVLSTWQIVFIIGAVLILNCLLVFYFIFNKDSIILAILLSCITLSMFFPVIVNSLDQVNMKLHWKGYNILADGSSLYGRITVFKKENNISFYNNGLYDFTYPDKLSAEEIHLTALQNIEAKNALVIGGGLNGSLSELLKYKNIGGIIYVELDPAIIFLSKKLLPEDAAPFSGKRISIINMDGRAFVKNSRQKFDLVIMNLPEPYTSSLNRFYTLEFFKEVREALSPEGAFSLALPSGENYIGPEHKRLLASTYHTLLNVFPEVRIIPGGTNIFLSSLAKGRITLDGTILGERLKTAKIDLLYLSPEQIPFRLSQDRIDQLKLQLTPSQPLNKDLIPINYFYDLLLWASKISDRLVKTITFLERIITIENVLRAVFTIGFLLLLLAKAIRPDFLPLAVMSSGFTGIALELIITLIFQIKTGYLYFQLGSLLAGFMLGLASGSYFTTRYMEMIKNLNAAFNYLFLTLSLYPFFILFFILKNTGDINILAFLTLLFFPAFIIGGIFSLAGRISSDKNDAGKSFGRFYAYDLFGSALGALLTTAVFIPLIGILNTLIVVACVNLVVLSVMLCSAEARKS